MLTLTAQYLESRPLPPSEKFPPAALVSVLDGTETLHLFARHDVLEGLAEAKQLDKITLELRPRLIDLAAVSGGETKGKAYRLTAIAVLDAGKPSK